MLREQARRRRTLEGCEVAEKWTEERSTWICSWVSDGFQGSGGWFGLKINYPIAKRQRQGNAPRMEPASATEIMKGKTRRRKRWRKRKSEDVFETVVWRGDGWEVEAAEEHRRQTSAGSACGKECLRYLWWRPRGKPARYKLGRDLANIPSVLFDDPTECFTRLE